MAVDFQRRLEEEIERQRKQAERRSQEAARIQHEIHSRLQQTYSAREQQAEWIQRMASLGLTPQQMAAHPLLAGAAEFVSRPIRAFMQTPVGQFIQRSSEVAGPTLLFQPPPTPQATTGVPWADVAADVVGQLAGSLGQFATAQGLAGAALRGLGQIPQLARLAELAPTALQAAGRGAATGATLSGLQAAFAPPGEAPSIEQALQNIAFMGGAELGGALAQAALRSRLPGIPALPEAVLTGAAAGATGALAAAPFADYESLPDFLKDFAVDTAALAIMHGTMAAFRPPTPEQEFIRHMRRMGQELERAQRAAEMGDTAAVEAARRRYWEAIRDAYHFGVQAGQREVGARLPADAAIRFDLAFQRATQRQMRDVTPERPAIPGISPEIARQVMDFARSQGRVVTPEEIRARFPSMSRQQAQRAYEQIVQMHEITPPRPATPTPQALPEPAAPSVQAVPSEPAAPPAPRHRLDPVIDFLRELQARGIDISRLGGGPRPVPPVSVEPPRPTPPQPEPAAIPEPVPTPPPIPEPVAEAPPAPEPVVSEPPAPEAPPAQEPPRPEIRVNLNEADLRTLSSIPGVGRAMAQRILETRQRLGGFQNVEQLREVTGIGPARFNFIARHVTVEAPPTPTPPQLETAPPAEAPVAEAPSVTPPEAAQAPAPTPRVQEPMEPSPVAPTAAAEGSAAPSQPIAIGERTRAATERGTEVETEWAIVDARNLVTSHDTMLRPNPQFPAELQPRDRTRVASELQITRMVNQLRPEFLAESPKASEGAPIVGPDMIVESGNARSIALKRAYEQNAPSAQQYREFLFQNAQRFGIDPDSIRQAEAPVLVRIRRSDVDRRQFVVEANEGAVAAMSATEQAISDAERMSEGIISIFDPGEEGDILSRSNRSFISAFLQQVVSPSERGRLLDAEGRLSQDGVNRIRNAVFARAYGDPSALAILAESTDSNVRNITSGMLMAAPRMVQIREGIRRGELFDLDPTSDIVAAMRKMSQLRSEGTPVDVYLRQTAMFEDDLTPLAKDFLQVFEDNKRSRKRISDILQTYADLVEALGHPAQETLFESRPLPRPENLLQAAIEKVNEGYVPRTRQASIFEGEPAGGGMAQEPTGPVAPEGGRPAGEPTTPSAETLGFPASRSASQVWYTGQQAATLEEAAQAKGSLYLTTDPDFAANYGRVFTLTVKPGAKVFNTADKRQVAEVVDRLFEDYADGVLPYELRGMIDRAIEEEGSEEAARTRIAEELSPDHIREESVYDSGDLQEWLWDTYEFDIVTFRDGDTALLLNAVGMATDVSGGASSQRTPTEVPRQSRSDIRGFPETATAPEARPVAHERPVPSTSRAERVVTRKEVMDYIERQFMMPIRVGRMRLRGARGEFNLKTHVTRLRSAEDFRAITHEFGHFLSETIPLNPEQYPELQPLGAALYPDAPPDLQREEGNAEFFYLYLSNPEAAKAAAPSYYADFEELLRKDPALGAKVRELQRMSVQLFNQTGTAAVKAMIVREEAKAVPLLNPVQRFYAAWVDDLHPIWLTMKYVLGEENIRSEWDVQLSQNPYIMGRLARGRYRKAHTLLTRAQISPTFENVGPSFRDILRPVAHVIDDFEAYLVAKRAVELWDRGVNPGIDLENAQKAVRELERPEFVEAQRQLVDYQNLLLDHLVEAGVISQDLANRIRTMNQYYVPFHRYFGEEVVSGGMAGSRLKWGNLPQPVKAIRGSSRSIYSPLHSIIRNTYTMIDVAERNRAARAFYELIKDKEGIGWLVEEVPTPMQPNRVELQRIKDDLIEAGVPPEALDEADLERVAVIFNPVRHARWKEKQENILTVFVDGQPRFLKLHPELYRAFQFMDQPSYNLLVQLLSFPTKVLRAGATMNIEFSPRNIFRDQFSALMNRKYRFFPFIDPARAMFSAFKGNLGLGDELYDKWVASGGAQSTMVSLNRDYLEKDLRRMIGQYTMRDRAVQLIRLPLTLLEFISSVAEESTRLSQFRAGLRAEGQTEEGVRRAAMASREISIDFQRAGTYGRQVNQFKAFFNAALQGTDQLARNWRRDPVGYTLRAFAFITLPSIVLYLLNRNDPRYWELPQWRRDLYWVFMGRDSVVYLPKPFELGVIFGTLAERILQWLMEDDPQAFEEFAERIFEATLPLDPTNPVDWLPDAATPFIEVWANRTVFGDRRVVPRGEEDLLPIYQYGPNTSEFAKALGRLTGQSPRQIQHLIEGYGAGLARHTLRFLDRLAGVESPTPIIRPFGGDLFVSAASIEEFYEELDQLEKLNRTANELQRRGLQEQVQVNQARLRYLRRIRDDLAGLRRMSRYVLDSKELSVEQKRQMLNEINLRMVNLARIALGKPPIVQEQQ